MQHKFNLFSWAEHEATAVDSGRLTLAEGAACGMWTSPAVESEPFDEVIPSWTALTPGQSMVETEVRVRLGGAWSAWYSLGRWGTGMRRGSVPGQRDDQAVVDVDTLRVLSGQADAVQARVALTRDDKGAGPTVYGLSLWSQVHGSRQPLSSDRHPAWGITLDAPQRSQAVESEDVRGHICSPTSLGMVLAYHGVERTTAQVCDGVFDYGQGIWGNWPFNAAYVLPASDGRLVGQVERWDGFAPLEDEIAQGRPVVLSHRWEEGELRNSPIPRSRSGHLIVVVGFDEQGNVVVNDPAANPLTGQSVRRVYYREDVYHTWLERASGVVYTVKSTEK